MATQTWDKTLRNTLLLVIGAGIFLILLIPLIVTAWPPEAVFTQLEGPAEQFGNHVFQRIFSGGFNTFFPYIVGKAVYGRIIIEVIFGLWLVLAFRFPEYRLRRSWIMALFALFLGASLIAGLTGVSINRSLWSTYERMQGIIDLLHWFAFTLVVATVIRDFKHWRWLWHANLVVALVVALLGIGQYLRIEFMTYLTYIERIESTVGNPVYVGAIMTVNILVAAALYVGTFEERNVPSDGGAQAGMSRRRRKALRMEQLRGDNREFARIAWRAFYVFVIAICLWALFLAGARGALFGLAAGVIAFLGMYVLWGRMKWVGYAGLGGMALLGLVAVLFFTVGLNSSLVQRLANNIPIVRELTKFDDEQENSVTSRWVSVRMGLKGFAQRPITGWGPENFSVAYDRNFPASSFSAGVESFDQAHSKPVEVLTTTGILGFLPWAAMWLYIFWVLVRVVRANRKMPLQMFTMFMAAGVVGYFVQNLFLFDTPATGLQLYLLLAFVVGMEIRMHAAPEFSDAVEGLETNAAPSNKDSKVSDTKLRPGFVDRARAWMDRMDMPAGVELGPVIILIVFATVFLSVKPFNAADVAAEPTRSWEVQLAIYEAAIEGFPPLANEIRLREFSFVAVTWFQLDPARQELGLAEVEQEFERAKRAEPEQWRVYLAVAAVFQNVGLTLPDSDYTARARVNVEKAKELAPERIEVNRALVQQYLREDNIADAEGVICDYLEKNRKARSQFVDLIDLIVALNAPEIPLDPAEADERPMLDCEPQE